MARPVTIKDETILQAAREVFLERGIQGTTAEVAERAGVSEGTVFNRFKSKVELFQTAMLGGMGDPAWLRNLPSRVGKGCVQTNLLELGREIIAMFRTTLPLMMMAWSNPASAQGELPALLRQPDPPPIRAMKRMAGYFEAEMRAQRMRRQDPEVVARTFLGALHSYVFFELLLKVHEELPLPEEMFLRSLVNLLWNGAAVRPEGS